MKYLSYLFNSLTTMTPLLTFGAAEKLIFGLEKNADTQIIFQTIPCSRYEKIAVIVYGSSPEKKPLERISNAVREQIERTTQKLNLRTICSETQKLLQADRENLPIDMTALFIKLTKKRAHVISGSQDEKIYSFIKPNADGSFINAIICNGNKPQASLSAVMGDAQKQAECLQRSDPTKPFHCVVDLEPWREMVAPYIPRRKSSSDVPKINVLASIPTCCLQ